MDHHLIIKEVADMKIDHIQEAHLLASNKCVVLQEDMKDEQTPEDRLQDTIKCVVLQEDMAKVVHQAA